MKIVALIQARMRSTRLPGKVLLPIGEASCLEHCYRRVQHGMNGAGATAVLTTRDTANSPIRDLCRAQSLASVRVAIHEGEVLLRHWFAAAEIGAEWVIRVTSDCPFIVPEAIGTVLERIRSAKDDDGFVYNRTEITTLPHGWDVQAFRTNVLWRMVQDVGESVDREHCGVPYLLRHMQNGGMVSLHPRYELGHETQDRSTWRWVLDTPEDYAWFQEIAKHVPTNPPHPTTQELFDLFERRPDLIRYEEDA
jgi:spore coat polysaccharide biosynthesis protein SpsF